MVLQAEKAGGVMGSLVRRKGGEHALRIEAGGEGAGIEEKAKSLEMLVRKLAKGEWVRDGMSLMISSNAFLGYAGVPCCIYKSRLTKIR